MRGTRALATLIKTSHVISPNRVSSNYYGDRSAVTQLLWDARTRVLEAGSKPPSTTILDKAPSDSYQELILPFSTDDLLRAQYVNPFKNVRLGRLLEDLDAFAGHVAFMHVDDGDDTTRLPFLVTAGLDRLDLIPRSLNPNVDLVLKGGVVSTGRSSLEIMIEAEQDNSVVLRTFFSFVARDTDSGKSTPVNKIVAMSEKDKLLDQEAKQNKLERIAHSSLSLHKTLPKMDELELIHSFFTEELSEVKRDYKWMVETRQNSLLFMSAQSRNIHGTVFGGYLMRQSFELAFATSYMFCGAQPSFRSLADISFIHPVPLGSLLDLRSEVLFTEGNSIQLMVEAFVQEPTQGTSKCTNVFYYTFDLYDSEEKPKAVPQVRPRSYAQAMKHIGGRRILHRANARRRKD